MAVRVRKKALVDKVIKLADEGETYANIAARLNIGVSTVCRALHQGIALKSTGRPRIYKK